MARAEGAEVQVGKSKIAREILIGALSKDMLMQVATKTTVKKVWDSLKVRFNGADRLRAERLATLRGEFDRLRMDDGDDLDIYAGKISNMAVKYAGLDATLDDAAMVNKLLDTVPDRLYAAIAGIEQFCDVDAMAFEEALGRLKAIEERTRQRMQSGGGRDASSCCSLPHSGRHDSATTAAGSTTRTTAEALRLVAMESGATAVTTAGSAGTSGASVRSGGRDRRLSRLSWATLTSSTKGSSRPWLRVCVCVLE